MNKERVYEYVEESGKQELMELLDAVVNRFRELHDDHELIVFSLRKGESRKYELDMIIDMLKKDV